MNTPTFEITMLSGMLYATVNVSGDHEADQRLAIPAEPITQVTPVRRHLRLVQDQ